MKGSLKGKRALHLSGTEDSEPRFRLFYKMILKLFVNDFENFYDMHCICI